VGGAHAIAVSNGGEPLDVGVEQHRKRRRLSFTELRELRRDGLHRAVMLAELGAGGDGMHGGRVTLRGERAGQLRRIGQGGRIEPGADPLGELGGTLLGEGRDGLLPAMLGEETEGTDGELVVGGRAGSVTGLGECIEASRTTTTTLNLRRTRTAGADNAVGNHRVEVAADARGGETETLAELRCGGGTKLHEQPGDAITGAGVCRIRRGISGLILTKRERHCFHNTSVP
jgi:hypothetical protein